MKKINTTTTLVVADTSGLMSLLIDTDANHRKALALSHILVRMLWCMSTMYPSELSDAEWECLQRHLPPTMTRRRRPRQPLRKVFDAIFYLLRTGCPWRYLPRDFPPWQTIYYHFRRFRLSDLWHRILIALRAAERQRMGKHPQPTAAIMDAQRERQDRRGVCRHQWLRCPQARQGEEAPSASRYLGFTAVDLRHPRGCPVRPVPSPAINVTKITTN
jgi:transposase